MKFVKKLALLLIGSAFSLLIGAFFLAIYSLVPDYLVETTLVAVIALYILAYYVSRGKIVAINVSTILGIAAPIISAVIPTHLGVLENIGSGGLIGFLGVLQLLGFFAFPIVFVILRIVYRSRLQASPVRETKANL
jgi:hypothetical protein